MCPLCRKRRLAKHSTACRTCANFIAEYVNTGLLQPRPVPLAADVALVMRHLGVSQKRAIQLLGGQP